MNAMPNHLKFGAMAFVQIGIVRRGVVHDLLPNVKFHSRGSVALRMLPSALTNA
jgi:hypothetical protein